MCERHAKTQTKMSCTCCRNTTVQFLLGIALISTFPALLFARNATHHSTTATTGDVVAAADADADDYWLFATTATDDVANVDPVNLTVVRDQCWTTIECSVSAEFNRINLRFKFPVNINCAERLPSAQLHGSLAPHIPQQYSNVPQIRLNGCGVNRSDTLGVEFVPDPHSVRVLQVRMFRVNVPLKNDTFERYAGLAELVLADNLLAGLTAGVLLQLQELRTLVISNNNLSNVDDDALLGLAQLENLTLYEPQLAVAAGLQLPPALRLWRLQAHSLTWLQRWSPNATLEQLSIVNTPVVYSSVEHLVGTLQSLHLLHTLELIACNLTNWPTFSHARLRTLNISHNRVQYLNEFRLPALQFLDLSSNRLLDIPDNVLRPAVSLRLLNVQHNRLDRLANNAFGGCAQLETVWLAGNRLRQIAPNLSRQQRTHIHIDANPWSCKWALDIADTHPQIFAHFRYVKVLDDMNMHGLRCQFYESGTAIATTLLPGDEFDVSYRVNKTTTLTPYRRHPKDTAMLTLIILVVGVTFLFLLLFLHIRCRRAAMQPFYRTLPYEQQQQQQQQHSQQPPNSQRRPQNGGQQQQQHPQPNLTGRTDFVRRELPATDYEAPILCRPSGPGGRTRMRTPLNSDGMAAGKQTAMSGTDDDVEEDIQLGHRVYEEIKECRQASVSPRREPTADQIDAVRPKQKFASMNNMLFDKSGNDDSH